MKHIVLTGGGTAGHVTPNIALIPRLKELGYEISYIGSEDGIESKLIPELGIPYYSVSTGKLRRYLSAKNISDSLKYLKGIGEAKKLLKKLDPDVIFSKGGFVAVPVSKAAAKLGIPYAIHESDMTPGLANKMSFATASKVCCNFPETLEYLPPEKAVLTGTPIRQELLSGDASAAKKFCGFTDEKPVIMVVGGSLGAAAVNEAVRTVLPELLKDYNIIHLCGEGKVDESFNGTEGYVQYTYIKKEMADLFALSDLVISRAGANAICEICALAKPNLLIPLSAKASRGDQILNARSFEKQGFSRVIEEEDLTDELLLKTVKELFENKDSYIDAMHKSGLTDSIGAVIRVIQEIERKEK